jgi:hypothetical protein
VTWGATSALGNERRHQLAVRSQRLEHVRQHVSEQHFVAQTLLAHHQEGLAGQGSLGGPGRPIDDEHGGGCELRVEPRLVVIPTFADPAHGDLDGGAGELHHRLVVLGPRHGRGRLAVFQRPRRVAAFQPRVAAVVAGVGVLRIEPQRLVVEQNRFLEVGLLGKHRAQGVPELGIGRVALDRDLQDFDRLGGATLVLHRRGQVAHRAPGGGVRRHVAPKQLLGEFLHAHSVGEAAEIVGDVGLFRQQRQRGLIGLDRLGEVAGSFARHGQDVPGHAGPGVHFERLERQLGAGLDVFGAQGVDRLAQHRRDGHRPQFVHRAFEPREAAACVRSRQRGRLRLGKAQGDG